MYGQDTLLLCSFQNSYGTSNVASLHQVEFISEGLSQSKEQIISENMRGVFDESPNREGKNMVEGDVVADLDFIQAGLFVTAMFGASVAPTGSYYRHTLTPRTADFDENIAMTPMTWGVQLGTIGTDDLYPDVCPTKLELGYANGELVKGTLSLVGGQRSNTSLGITAAPREGNYASWNTSSLTLNGSADVSFRDLNITVEEPVEGFHTLSLGNYPRRYKRSGKRVVSIAGTIQFDDRIEYSLFISQTSFPLVMNTTDSTGEQQMKVDLPNCKFTEFPVEVGAPGQMEVSFAGKAEYLASSATSITITIVNSMAGY